MGSKPFLHNIQGRRSGPPQLPHDLRPCSPRAFSWNYDYDMEYKPILYLGLCCHVERLELQLQSTSVHVQKSECGGKSWKSRS